MDQQAFKTMLESEGFEVVVVEREANISMDLHSHPFEAKAMILEGEIRVVVDGKETHCCAGDTFHLNANIMHTETYGPTGVKYIAGRKAAAGFFFVRTTGVFCCA